MIFLYVVFEQNILYLLNLLPEVNVRDLYQIISNLSDPNIFITCAPTFTKSVCTYAYSNYQFQTNYIIAGKIGAVYYIVYTIYIS